MPITAPLSATSPLACTYLSYIVKRDMTLRASKPKPYASVQYVWRMVGFYASTDHKLQCMPVCADWDVVVPEGYLPEPPADWLAAKIDNAIKTSSVEFCIQNDPDKRSIEGYYRHVWDAFSTQGRRQHYIKNVLDPIVDEIVSSVPVTRQHGTMRWGRALGYIS